MTAPVPTVAALLVGLETLSRQRADRVLRLRGIRPPDSARQQPQPEPFELLIFRGFSSSTTHPTSFDADQPVLTADVVIQSAELLEGPLNPAAERLLAGPLAPEQFLDPVAWL